MYQLNEVKWGVPTYGTPSGTINWSADLGGLTTTAGVTESDLDAALQSAFDAWEAVADIDFQQVSSGGQVSVYYDAMGYNPGGSNVAGTASWGPDVGGVLNSLSAGIIEFNSDLTWADYGSGGFDFFAIALHEIGHIIGLGHVSDRSEIMSDLVVANNLGSGDIDGAQFIYGTSGGTSGTPASGGSGSGAIGLLLGLLALIVGLFSGGGGGMVAMAAAGHLPDPDDGAEDGNAMDHLPLLPMEGLEADFLISHAVHAVDPISAEAELLPMVEHDCQPKACGCFGQCVHEDVDPEDLFDWA